VAEGFRRCDNLPPLRVRAGTRIAAVFRKMHHEGTEVMEAALKSPLLWRRLRIAIGAELERLQPFGELPLLILLQVQRAGIAGSIKGCGLRRPVSSIYALFASLL
jgi:hypothetical protein